MMGHYSSPVKARLVQQQLLKAEAGLYRLMPLKRFNNNILTSTSVWWWEIWDSPTYDCFKNNIWPSSRVSWSMDQNHWFTRQNYYTLCTLLQHSLNSKISTHNTHTHPCLREYLKWQWFPLLRETSPIFFSINQSFWKQWLQWSFYKGIQWL